MTPHDALLGLLHIAQADVGGDLQIVPDALGHTGGHILEDLVGNLAVGALEGQHQILGIAVPQETLYRALIHGDDIFKHEHPLPDLVSQLGIMLGQMVENTFFTGAVQVVHYTRHIVHTAHLDLVGSEQVCKLFLHFRLNDFYGGRRRAFHIGDALHHPYLGIGVQFLHHAAAFSGSI